MNENLKTKQLPEFLWGPLTFLGVFGYGLLWIWQGFDVTDEGLNLTWYWLTTIEDKDYEIFYFSWLTSVVGGQWLLFVDTLGLWGGRLGWALVMGFSAWISFVILSPQLGRKKTVFYLLLTAMVSFHWMTLVINYTNFPVLLLLCAMACFLKAELPVPPKNLNPLVWSLFGGIFLGAAFQARFPMIISLGLPLLIVTVNIYIKKSPIRAEFKKAGSVFMGWLICVGLGLSYLWSTGRLSHYLSFLDARLFAPKDELHALGHVWKVTQKTMISGVLEGLSLGLTAIISYLLIERVFRVGRIWKHTLFGIVFFAVLVSIISGPHFDNDFSELLFGIAMSLSMSYVWLYLKNLHRSENADEFLVFLFSLATVFLSFAGSVLGTIKVNFGLWLLFPFLFVKIPLYLQEIKTPFGYPNSNEVGRYFFMGILVICLVGMGIRFMNPFRDLRNRLLLTEEIRTPYTRGIYTSTGRAQCSQELLNELEKRVRPLDKLLVTDIPMVYYLTRTLPLTKDPRPSRSLRVDDLKTRLKEIEKTVGFSKFSVRAKMSLGDRNWGHESSPLTLNPPTSTRIMNRFLVKNGYHVV